MEPGHKEDSTSLEAGIRKACSHCKTTETPLWRSGPSGPKSLCNACGIRYRKKRPSPSAYSKNDQTRSKLQKSRSLKLKNAIKMTWMPFQDESDADRQWGEVERAALLLMALSCGCGGVFA